MCMKKYTQEQRFSHVKRAIQNRQTDIEYCLENSINVSDFRRWAQEYNIYHGNEGFIVLSNENPEPQIVYSDYLHIEEEDCLKLTLRKLEDFQNLKYLICSRLYRAKFTSKNYDIMKKILEVLV